MGRPKGSKNKNPIPPIKRFWSKVIVTSNCWEWIGCKTSNNYGMIRVGKMIPAHRFIWQFLYGEIPEEMCVLHHCDNPSCVNPEHLFLGTHQDNMNDKVRKNRQRNGISLGEAHGATKLRNEDIWEIRRLYAIGKFYHRQIAEMFLVSRKTICNIVNRTTWKHI